MANTYLVIGSIDQNPIVCQEIEAQSPEEAIDKLESRWGEFTEAPTVRLITEAEKLERLGAPSLFPLPPKG